MTLQCFGTEQIFVGIDGNVRSCCIADVEWYPPGSSGFRDLYGVKARNNADLRTGNLRLCRPECEALYEVSDPAAPSSGPSKIVVWTNTLCPLRCTYCSQAWPHDERGVPLVTLPKNNIENLGSLLRDMLSAPGARTIREIELSGGDSAFHPEFCDILDLLAEFGTKTIYLSSGIVPDAVRSKIREKLSSGELTLSISPDACTAGTWSRVKRRPAEQFEKVREFIDDAAAHAAYDTQLWVKYIATKRNAHEALDWIPYWYGRGARSFCVSAYRPDQAIYRTSVTVEQHPDELVPLPEDQLREVCRAVEGSLRSLQVDRSTRLDVIDLERFFGGQRHLEKRVEGVAPGPQGCRSATTLAEDFVGRGGRAFLGGRVDAAERLLRNAVEFRPEHAQAHNDLGVVLHAQGDMREAARHIGQALQLEPRNREFLRNAQDLVAQSKKVHPNAV